MKKKIKLIYLLMLDYALTSNKTEESGWHMRGQRLRSAANTGSKQMADLRNWRGAILDFGREETEEEPKSDEGEGSGGISVFVAT